MRLVAAIREHYREAMARVMSAEDAAAIFAMLFGGYAGLNPELVEDFQTTGIVHILSVSGAHMSMMAAFAAWLCALMKFPRGVTFAVGVFLIGTYAILSGLLPQVLRSATMGILIFFAKTLDAEAEGARLLSLTAGGMLINQPLLLFDVSFQLSFTATAGLMYLAEDLEKFFERLPKFFSTPMAMTIAAQLASLPVVVWYFNQIYRRRTFGRINRGSHSARRENFFHGRGVNLRGGRGAESNLREAAAQCRASADTRIDGGVFLLRRADFASPDNLVADNFFVRAEFFQGGRGRSKFRGRGARRLRGGHHAAREMKMFDVGGRVVVPYLKHENIRAVEKIFLTHVHEDHAGGAGAVIKKFPVGEIITAGESKSEYAAVFGIAEEFLPQVRAGRAGEKFSVDGVEVEILFAPSVGTGNEISNVYRIRCGEVTFLITGDLVKEIEAEILRAGVDVKSTVLKVGHHGSATSSSEEFLRAVNPKCAVICVGYGNNFDHPRAEVLERLENLPTKIYRTDRDGLIKFKTDGKTLSVETFNR